jgi:hypothetical protein
VSLDFLIPIKARTTDADRPRQLEIRPTPSPRSAHSNRLRGWTLPNAVPR